MARRVCRGRRLRRPAARGLPCRGDGRPFRAGEHRRPGSPPRERSALPDGKLRRQVASALAGAGLGFSLAGAGISAEFAQRPTEDPLPALHAILDLPLRAVPANTRAVIVFDEFQAIRSIRALDAFLRWHVQHQRKHASFGFCGSEQGMLDALFDDPDASMYGQYSRCASAAARRDRGRRGHQEVRRDRPRHWRRVSPLILIADGHPQRAMLLSHLVWGLTVPTTAPPSPPGSRRYGRANAEPGQAPGALAASHSNDVRARAPSGPSARPSARRRQGSWT